MTQSSTAPPLADFEDHQETRDEPASFLAPAIGRALDLVIGALALLFFAPLFILIGLLILIFDPGPVLFRHKRIGRNGQEFGCWKFRSMVVDAETRLAKLLEEDPAAAAEWRQTQKLRYDPRITPLGHFLRRTSLDELPQLLNVLTGEMSLVGPRPIVEDEVARYGQAFALYCLVRPGMTGLWQISGRSDLSYEERVLLDAEYVTRKSVREDVKIILLTVPRVLMAKGSR